MNLTTITHDMIVSALVSEQATLKSTVMMIGIITAAIVAIFVIKFRKRNETKKYVNIIKGIVIIAAIVFVFQMYKKCDAISYSINNSCYKVEQDVISQKDIKYINKADRYYLNLSKYGKISVSQNQYEAVNNGDVVCVVVIKGRFGGTYIGSTVYPVSQYVFDQSMNFK